MVVAYWTFFFPTDEAISKMEAGEFFEGTLTTNDILGTRAIDGSAHLHLDVAVHPVFEGDADILSLLYQSMVEAVD